MADLNKLLTPLFLSEKEIRKIIELMFFSYRDFTAGPDAILEKIQFGQLLLHIFDSARRFNLNMQPSLMLLQKTLINIEGLGKQLYPNLDFWSIAKPFLQEWITDRYNPRKLEAWAKKNAGYWIEKATKLPEVAENVLDQINKIEDYQKESEKRHEELISTLNKLYNKSLSIHTSLLLFPSKKDINSVYFTKIISN